jgi:hypothetical protein
MSTVASAALGAFACAVLLVGPAYSQCPVSSPDPAFERLINMSAKSQKDALRAMIASHIQLVDPVFYYSDRLRPGLRLLAGDRERGGYATELLALIGEPEDLRALIEKPPRSDRAWLSRWAYQIACSLLAPSSEEDWSFLRKCALRQTGDPWAVTSAIQTLRLIASPRAREILVEAQAVNQGSRSSISSAIEYIDSRPAPLAGADLGQLGERVVQALAFRGWKSNGPPRCNQKRDAALINFKFEIGRDLYIYTATFHKTDDTWKLRGVRESAQALMMPQAR